MTTIMTAPMGATVKVAAAGRMLPGGKSGGNFVKVGAAAERLAQNKAMGKAAEVQAKIDLEATGIRFWAVRFQCRHLKAGA